MRLHEAHRENSELREALNSAAEPGQFGLHECVSSHGLSNVLFQLVSSMLLQLSAGQTQWRTSVYTVSTILLSDHSV